MESDPPCGPTNRAGRTIPLRNLLFGRVAVVVVGVLLIAGVGWGQYFWVRNRREAGERLQETAYLTGQRLGTYLERHRQLIVMLAREIDEGAVRDPAALARILLRARETNPSLLTMLVARADGRIIATSPVMVAADQPGGDQFRVVSDRAYFTEPARTGQPHVSNAFQGRGFGTDPIVAVSAPLRSPAGEFDGVVEGSLDLSRLNEFEAGRNLITAGDIVMIDAARRVVYATDKVRHPPLTAFRHLEFGRPRGATGRAAASEGVLPAEKDLPAKDVLFGWAPVQGAGMAGPWIMTVLQDQSASRALFWRQLGYLGVGLAGALGLASLVAHRVARRVTWPVEQLAVVARQAAHAPGEVGALKLESTRVQEIGEMQAAIAAMHGRWLDMMARLQASLAEQESMAKALRESRGELETSHHQLEQRVIARTMELRDTVGQLESEVARRRGSELRLEEKNRTMELIAMRAPLPSVLNSILTGIERDEPELIASIMLVSEDGRQLRLGASLRMPAEYCAALGAVEIGPMAGSCGAAACTRGRVVVADIGRDPRWERFRAAALASGLRACWSTPIVGAQGELFGTFAVYYRQPGTPREDHVRVVELASHTAAVAIGQERAERAREQLAEKLGQTHKLEALGTLAGGIAHGFNNLLVPILSYAEIIARESNLGPEARTHLSEIVRASRQARSLVQQMLAFSRKQTPQQQPVDLVPLIADTSRLLRLSAAANISIVAEPGPAVAVVVGDGAQFHHLLMNLGTNAIQAMTPQGGSLTLALRVVPGSAVAGLVPAPGEAADYLCLEVRDTGPGIAPGVRERIFDPFFTTKPVGSGTGLGLAVVHGIVSAHQGAITVESEPARGALFRVYLPAAHGQSPPADAAAVPAEAVGRSKPGRIMLVDDETFVARATAAVLRSRGCAVEVFACAEDALARLWKTPAEFDLLVSDVTMPGMSGVDLAMAAAEVRPDLNVILMTGHGQVDEARLRTRTARHKVLGKPFDAEVLIAAVEELLPPPRPAVRAAGRPGADAPARNSN
ncbi:MAG: response regulator [Verrucomicrobia bacterium]|nr:response regulator [Verrucomicrobiota bacterium]